MTVTSEDVKSVEYIKARSLHDRVHMKIFFPIYCIFIGISQLPPLAGNSFLITISLVLIVFFNILTILSCLWYVRINRFFNYLYVSQQEATHVLITPQLNRGPESIEPIKNHKKHGKYFNFMKIKFVFDPLLAEFVLPAHPDDLIFTKNSRGFIKDEDEIDRLRWNFGQNQMTIELPTFFALFFEKATAPFFVFQTFCMLLWCLDEYWAFPMTSLVMLVSLEALNTVQQLKYMNEIRSLGNSRQFVEAYRFGKWTVIPSTHIVPRDLVFIDGKKGINTVIPCDMVLVGGSCVTDESLLTGESLPVMKESLKESGEQRESLNMLYSGTKLIDCTTDEPLILKTNDGILCVAVRTGFNSYQGRLLKIILQNVKIETLHNLDSILLILLLLCFGLSAAVYVWIHAQNLGNRYKLLLKCLFIVTSILPPELPLELSLAVNASLKSLSKARIFCTEPFRIPFAGQATICCFDKTGTLTSDQVVLSGLNGLDNSTKLCSTGPPESLMAIASCNSLHFHKTSVFGDPLEMELLSFSGYAFTGPNNLRWALKNSTNPTKIEIIKRFHFNSALRRMSVISRYFPANSNVAKYFVAVKGAPEALKSLFARIPENYDQIVQHSMSLGFRVLAVGYRLCNSRPDSKVDPAENLEFGGFLNFKVEIKPESYQTVSELQKSSHHIMMITGDSVHTAAYVARELGILSQNSAIYIEATSDDLRFLLSEDGQHFEEMTVPQFESSREHKSLCVSGNALSLLGKTRPALLESLLPHVSVFARTDPQQKQHILSRLALLGHFTTMCGDGTNDVGALKQAHVGVAVPSKDIPDVPTRAVVAGEESVLTELGDASIAAPFSSKNSSPICVRDIIREGRGAFVKTLQMFKILALNAFISSYGQSVLYLSAIRIGDLQASVQGICCTLLVFNITSSLPATRLSSIRPPKTFFTVTCLLSVFAQFLVNFWSLISMNGQLTSFESVYNISVTNITYSNSTGIASDSIVFSPSITNSCIWLLSLAMDVNACLVNYRGSPFMQSLREQRTLLYAFLAIHGFICALLFGLIPDVQVSLSLVDIPDLLRTHLLMVIILNFFITYSINSICEFISDRWSR